MLQRRDTSTSFMNRKKLFLESEDDESLPTASSSSSNSRQQRQRRRQQQSYQTRRRRNLQAPNILIITIMMKILLYIYVITRMPTILKRTMKNILIMIIMMNIHPVRIIMDIPVNRNSTSMMMIGTIRVKHMIIPRKKMKVKKVVNFFQILLMRRTQTLGRSMHRHTTTIRSSDTT